MTKKTLTNEQVLSILKRLSPLLSSELGMTTEEIKEVVKNFPELLTTKIETISACIILLKNKYEIQKEVLKPLVMKSPDILTSITRIERFTECLNKTLGMTPSEVGKVIPLNSHLLYETPENIEAFVNSAKEKQIDPTIIKLLLKNKNLLSLQEENVEKRAFFMQTKLNLLRLYGLSKEEINENPNICNNLTSMNKRLQLAYLNGVFIDSYIKNSYFVYSEERVWATMQTLKEKGLTQYLPYMAKPVFFNLTGETIENAMKKYPWTATAKLNVSDEFLERFPTLGKSVETFFNNLSKERQQRQIDDYYSSLTESPATTDVPQTPKVNNKANKEKVPETTEETIEVKPTEAEPKQKVPYFIQRACRILRVDETTLEILRCGLGISELTEKNLSPILLNATELQNFGFETAEIIANPKCLKLAHEDLLLRVKLAKINNRTNRQFLTRDYQRHQDTIFARTCGAKILKNENCANIYDSEENFKKSFGGDTETLKRFCRLDDYGKSLIDNLYEKTIQTADETENE